MMSPSSFPFEPDKATEVAACLTLLEGGSINVLKLVKLIYLLDRESIEKRGISIVGGVYFSMKNGPVTSEILDLINSGELWKCETNWARFIAPRAGYAVELIGTPGSDHLSEWEQELIAGLYQRFGQFDQWGLSKWCHENCGEWVAVESGRDRISLARLAMEVGWDPGELEQSASEQEFVEHAIN